MVKRVSKYGEFLACGNYPKCKNIQSIVKVVGVCPDCHGDVIERKSKNGKIFYGCKNYPDCQAAYWNLPVDAVCPDCGRHLVEKAGKNQEKTIICENKECPSNQKEIKAKRGRKKANE